MIFNYDLRRQPVTFDFVTFLTLCEQERLLMQKESFYVYINPEVNNFQKTACYDWKWRITHLLMPLAMMMPNCCGVGIGTKGRSLGYRTKDIQKEVYFDKSFKHITAGETALNIAYKTQNLITLRQRRWTPERNSNLEAWRDAFIGEPYSLIEDLEVYPRVENINVEVRMAMYMQADMNWGVANGCGALWVFNPTIPYRVFKIVTESVPCTSKSHIKAATGMNIGDQPHIATENQKYIWMDDTKEAIREELKVISSKPS